MMARGLPVVMAALLVWPGAQACAQDAVPAEGLVARGQALLATGRRDEAAELFRRAREMGAPDSLTARLELALLDLRAGERASAMRELDAFIDLYNQGVARSASDLLAVGRAVQVLGRTDPQLFRDALRAFDEAAAADPSSAEAKLLAGELFLEKYNATDARESFQEVLRAHPEHPRALLGMARVLEVEGSPDALEPLMKALEEDRDLVPARVMLARHRLITEDYAGALDEVERALSVDGGSVEALAVRAGIHYLRGEESGYEAALRRAREAAPGDPSVFTVLGDLAVQHRRYEDAVRFAREAIEVDSLHWDGHGLLGLNLLRVGAIEEGRAALEHAFGGDPYNVWIKNTLDLLDTFDQYEIHETEHFRLVLHGREAELLAPWVGELAEEAYAKLVERYGTAPPTPIRLEVFPRHADFSVRTVGLAGMGALGVSFGPVVAMDSPSARDAGEFNWGSTLWHEIAHSVHLAMTGHRVPRWLTEGLAVLEERRARAGWGDDVSLTFLETHKRGGLLPVSRLNDGFIRPSFPGQLGLSYYQASLVVEMIEEQHGWDAVLELLRSFGDGATGEEAFRRALGLSPDRLDSAFEGWLEARFAAPLAAVRASSPDDDGPGEPPADPASASPDVFAEQLVIGRVLHQQGKVEEALPFLERAAELFPEYAAPDSPHKLLAEIYRRRGDARRAAEALRRYLALNGTDLQAHLALAELERELGDAGASAALLERAVYIDPFQPELHRTLAEVAAEAEEWQAVVGARRALLALEPVDLADAHVRLAEAQLRAGDRQAARRSVLRALEVAPNFAEAQELLLRIVEGGGR